MPYRACLLACLVTGLALVVGCGGKPPPATAGGPDQDASREQHFIFNNGAEPEYLDPGKASGHSGIRLINQLFEGLVSLDPRTLEPIPGVAASWDVSDDNLIYTFHLRPDASWSDGSPLTAEDFRRSWLRVLDPATGAKYADQLYLIAGAEDRHAAGGRVEDVAIAAVDDATLRVTLRAPAPYFLELCAFTTYMPVPAAPVAEHGDAWTQPGRIVSNGPFVLAEWLERERIVLVPNEHWHGRDQVRLTRVTALPHANHESVYQQYLADAVHWMDTISAAKLEEARRHPDFYTAPFLATYYYRFNCSEPPFDDVRVRRAFSQAIDRAYLCAEVTKLGEIPTTSYTPAMPGYQPPPGPGYDPVAAQEQLDAWRSDGNDLGPIAILFNDSEAHRKIAEAIAQMWRETLGVQVATRSAEWKSYLKDLDNLNYQVARSGWIGDYTDPYTFLSCFRAGGGNNRTGWGDPAYDAGLEASQQVRDPEARAAKYAELEGRLLEAQPIAPIYTYVNKGLLKPYVRGLHHNARDLLYCRTIWLED